ncbi:unnamed protein product [Miscanthus lutarioriparius]|uniref:Uncharacterized protein n=1 Tax=Miscanthus lutarioriparius TaxID=422564 RepID=A0A811QK42_9POAL|nr:unnamed protein product [Miscanthus lutarioriparius]
MEVGADGVALITIANPPVNALHPISKRPTDASFFLGVQFFRGFAFGGVSFLRSNPVLLPNLSPAVIAGLKEKYAEAMRRDDVKAIVLTGAGGKFCGGFDINVFTKVHQTGDVSLMPDVSVELVSNMMEVF